MTDGGRIGVVLPRSALVAKGSTEFRRTMFRGSTSIDITVLQNNRNWVFDDLTSGYSVGLVCITRGKPTAKSIHLRGPYISRDSFKKGISRRTVAFGADNVLKLNDTASLPLLPSERSVEIFAQLRAAPRLDLNETRQWRARPYRELDATNDQSLMDLKNEICPKNFWPVYKGESFNLWTPDTGTYYAFANPEPVINWMQNKRMRAARRKRQQSPPGVFARLSLQQTNIALFWPSNSVSGRDQPRSHKAVIACLIPPKIFIANQAPYFLGRAGDERDQAFLLGVLSSVPFDWYARCFIELHVSFLSSIRSPYRVQTVATPGGSVSSN